MQRRSMNRSISLALAALLCGATIGCCTLGLPKQEFEPQQVAAELSRAEQELRQLESEIEHVTAKIAEDTASYGGPEGLRIMHQVSQARGADLKFQEQELASRLAALQRDLGLRDSLLRQAQEVERRIAQLESLRAE